MKRWLGDCARFVKETWDETEVPQVVVRISYERTMFYDRPLTFLLRHLPLALVLNYYAFLLDALVALLGYAGWWCLTHQHSGWGWTLCVLGVLLLIPTVGINFSWKERRKIFFTLHRRNRRQLHEESFKKFIGVLCHRLVTRTVLARLGYDGRVYRRVLNELCDEATNDWRRKRGLPEGR